MKPIVRIAVILVVAVAAAAALYLKNKRSPAAAEPAAAAVAESPASGVPAVPAKLPKLIDLGADKCIPCKMMAPILEELEKEYAGRMEVVFIDVWKNEGAGKQYGVQTIPTQIFFDAEGKELFRHTGFFGKEEILAKWLELGVKL